MSDNLYFTDLPIGVTEDQFREVMSPYGTIRSLKLLVKPGLKPHALIRYGSADEAAWIVQNLNGNIPQGLTEPIQVRYAQQGGKGGKDGWGAGMDAWGGMGGMGGHPGMATHPGMWPGKGGPMPGQTFPLAGRPGMFPQPLGVRPGMPGAIGAAGPSLANPPPGGLVLGPMGRPMVPHSPIMPKANMPDRRRDWSPHAGSKAIRAAMLGEREKAAAAQEAQAKSRSVSSRSSSRSSSKSSPSRSRSRSRKKKKKKKGKRSSDDDDDDDMVEAASGAGGTVSTKVVVPITGDMVSPGVKDVALSMLGMASEELPIDTPLMDAGLDSLSMVEFRNELIKEFGGINLPGALLFDHPTIGAVSGFIADQIMENGLAGNFQSLAG
mmetsp:Transcript_159022/g.292959  ORF Transcript_159022/g.292959 Transcript_159022/m.292959 type:complete len:380 (+) Transcript_159022:46-1185(+)